MRNKSNIIFSCSSLFSFSFAAFLVNSHYLGFIIERVDTEGLIGLAILGLLYPLVILFIANSCEMAKKICLFACGIAAVVGSYFVLLRADNFRLPTFELDMLTLMMYFVTLASSICLTMISFAEIMRISRKEGNHSILFGLNLMLAGVITGIAVALGIFGWLIPLMLNDYTIPAGILLYFLWYPENDDEQLELSTLHKPNTISKYAIRDSSKGFKLTMYTILSAFQVAIILAGNGLGIDPTDFYLLNWIFWICMGVGGLIMMILFKVKFGKVHEMEASLDKRTKSQVDWLVVSLIQLGAFVGMVVLEFYVANFHGSILSHIITGLFLGLVMSGFFKQVVTQHPPRSMYIYMMFLSAMILYGIIGGSFLKALSGVGMTEFYEDIAPYVLYLIGLVVIVWALLFLALLTTMKKKKIKPIRLNLYQKKKQKRQKRTVPKPVEAEMELKKE